MNTNKNNPTTIYMIVKGETANWMVPVCGTEGKIFKLDLMDQSGCGGDLVRFKVELRHGFKEVMFIGPHKSSFADLFKDTGMDIADLQFQPVA